jgi:hypothetical protein
MNTGQYLWRTEVNPLKIRIRRRDQSRCLALIVLLLLLFTSPITSVALDDDEFSGNAADTLTIEVGYFGGPYYEKHVFTLDELESMDIVYDDYTFIDNMPSVIIDHVKGVRLADLMDAAGIDLGSIQTFYFWTKDKTSSYYTSFPKTELIDTPRYCYYSLPDNFDYDVGAGNEYATSDAQLVDTVIALADDWNRCIAGATFGSDYLNLNTNTRFRLIFGQIDAVTRTASRSAKWVHSVVVELGGAPTITMNASVLDLEVGSLFRTEASIGAADPVIAENAEIKWSSSDENIVTVDKEGNITVRAEGTAEITAEFMGATASVTVNGSAAKAAQTTGGAGNGSEGTVASGNPAPASRNSFEETGISETIPESGLNGGDGYNIIQNEVLSGGGKGGVQNWRVYEMSETAVELPVIKEDNPLMPVIAVLAICLPIGGAIYRVFRFKFDIGDKVYVFNRKSK